MFQDFFLESFRNSFVAEKEIYFSLIFARRGQSYSEDSQRFAQVPLKDPEDSNNGRKILELIRKFT